MSRSSILNRAKPMTVAGMMSGTSADGVDIAIVRLTGKGSGERKLALLQHSSYSYSTQLRKQVLAAMDAQTISTAELARLNWRLGIAYAEAAQAALKVYGRTVDLVGCHGQTLYHQGVAAPYAGRSVACTWQLGEMALLSSATKLPVVSNFRPADMAAGGHGAPLVSYLDHVLFQSRTRNRVLQNLGGIGNLTAMPANAGADKLIAFDTGPANMIIDALMQTLFGKAYDRNGKIAARGIASSEIVAQAMRNPYFKLQPPKSAGREQFGERYAADFLRLCKKARLGPEEAIATATAFTVESIRVAFERFVKPALRSVPTDYIVAGGGAKNATLMRRLGEALEPFKCSVTTTDTFGLPTQAKEAAAFALLAYETWHRRPSNVPAATGARRPAILGQVSYFA
jgi:anhydro-N-acetylmuramic acid kinase